MYEGFFLLYQHPIDQSPEFDGGTRIKQYNVSYLDTGIIKGD